jgi:hypothetical protein
MVHLYYTTESYQTIIPLWVTQHSFTKPDRFLYQNTVKIKTRFSITIHLPDRKTKRFKEIMVEMRAAWISSYNWQLLCQFGQQLTKKWNNTCLKRWKRTHHSCKNTKAKYIFLKNTVYKKIRNQYWQKSFTQHLCMNAWCPYSLFGKYVSKKHPFSNNISI